VDEGVYLTPPPTAYISTSSSGRNSAPAQTCLCPPRTQPGLNAHAGQTRKLASSGSDRSDSCPGAWEFVELSCRRVNRASLPPLRLRPVVLVIVGLPAGQRGLRSCLRGPPIAPTSFLVALEPPIPPRGPLDLDRIGRPTRYVVNCETAVLVGCPSGSAKSTCMCLHRLATSGG